MPEPDHNPQSGPCTQTNMDPRDPQITVPYLGLRRTLEVPDWGLSFDFGLDMVAGLLYIRVLNFGSLS